jgi:hypothetical protein
MSELDDQMNFNANDTEIIPDFEILPEDTYLVTVDSLEKRTTRAGDGKYIAVSFDIVTGPLAGRKVFERYNIENQNPKTVAWAKSSFAKFLIAAGKPMIKTLGEVQGQTLYLKVGITEKKGTNEKQNVIRRYISKDSRPVDTSRPGPSPETMDAMF